MWDDKAGMKLVIAFFVLLLFFGLTGWRVMIWMPGKSFKGEVKNFTKNELALAQDLSAHVAMLAEQIGERNYSRYQGLIKSRDYIAEQLGKNRGNLRLDDFEVKGLKFSNLELEFLGSTHPNELIIIGAHYDTHRDSPGANDNASGVAAMLALAKLFTEADLIHSRTVRFVAFANEEMPFFGTGEMGSRLYAERSRLKKEDILLMISLETMGYYSTRAGSQRYPRPLSLIYPDRGDFIAFVSDVRSSSLLRRSLKIFRKNVDFPSEGAALPRFVPGVAWSDHSSFWSQGYRAFMVTDTAPFRYPYYHHELDLPDKIDFKRLARVVKGLDKVIQEFSTH